MSYISHLLVLLSIYSLLSMSASLNLRWTGLFNVALAALFGIGAYTAALLPTPTDFKGVLVTLVLSGLAGLLISLVLSLALRALRGDYFALATLAFGLVFVSVVRNSVEWLGGARGIPHIERPAVFSSTSPVYDLFGVFAFAICAGLFFLIRELTRSPVGAVLLAQKHNPATVAVMGYSVLSLRVLSLGVTAFSAGVAGCLYAWHLGVVVPTSFSVAQSFTIITMAIIGGIRSAWGPPLGALLILMIPEGIAWVKLGSINSQIVAEIVSGAFLIAAIAALRVSGRY